MRIVSVNAGRERDLDDGRSVHRSAIVKTPLEGDVRITVDGVASDEIADARFHGGPDQAVYAYSQLDYDWWQKQTGRSMRPGLFGENLTIDGLPTAVSVGDRLLIGNVVLEATGPRIPCAKLGAVMEDADFPAIFREARRPGCYFRVLSPGRVASGDLVNYLPTPDRSVSSLELFDLYYDASTSREHLQRALAAPLASRLRLKLKKRLDAADA